MDPFPEVLVVSDSGNKVFNCNIYDLKEGNVIASFKEGSSEKRGLAFIGEDYIISAFKQQPVLKTWSLSNSNKEEIKMTCPGLVSCLAVTSCGSYCIAGIDKSIYIWEVSTGDLLTSLEYHSKTVTCLGVSSDGSHFISGSGDGMVLVWLLSKAVAEAEMANEVRPRFTWLDHSGEVTDIYVGGLGVHARVATASRDMTCRLYELVSGFLLFTVRVDYGITAVVMDELEYFLVLGSAEGGIYRINLFSSNEAELHYNEVDTKCAFLGHSKEITCLSLSLSGKILVSGSEDHCIKIWDMTNFSCVKTLQCAGVITNAFITMLPPGLNDESKFTPRFSISQFKRQYTRKDEEGIVVTRINPKKLSLFHLGTPDVYFDSKVLINSTASTDDVYKSDITVKDVKSINAQMYAFALCDTMKDYISSDSAGEEEESD